MKRIGFIGLGNIGLQIAMEVANGKIENARVTSVFDPYAVDNFSRLHNSCLNKITLYDNFEEFIGSDIDIVVEASHPDVVNKYAEDILCAGKSFLAMSIGGLIGPGFLDHLHQTAKQMGVEMYVPAGAMTGINVIKAASLADGLSEVKIQSTKHPDGLIGAPFFNGDPNALSGLEKPTVIFRGNVYDAVRYFPQNVNVAAGLALAGLGPEKTKVEMIADPNAIFTVHRVKAKGSFGKMDIKLSNRPCPENPRTAYLAVIGAIEALYKVTSPIKLGY